MELFSTLFTLLSISFSEYPWLLLLCYAIHEAGHVFFAYVTGAKIGNFRSGLFRLCISYDCSNLSYFSEGLVYSGGIIFNLLASLICHGFFVGAESGRVSFFILCNLSLGLMNIYPVSVLDGGGILKCVFSKVFDEEKCEKITRTVSFVFVLIMWFFAVYLQLIFSSDISLFLISVFLMIRLCFSL